MPIYRLSDLYLAAGKPAEKIFEEKMAPLITVERPRKVRESDEENLNQVLDKWINKQNEDFCERKKDEMTQ
jgi:CRISPR/Cas system CSM-associated protein Csm2 small subunit